MSGWKERLLGTLMTLMVSTGYAQSAVVNVDFDDVDASLSDVPITGVYDGLIWSGWTIYTSVPGFDGFNNGIVSPVNAAYGGGEVDAGIPLVASINVNPGQVFTFVEATFGAGYYDGMTLVISGLRNGSPLYSKMLEVNTFGAYTASFDFKDIDTLTFQSIGGSAISDPYACGAFNCTQFTMDSASFVVSEVPEPSSCMYFIGGLIVLGRVLASRRST